MAAYVLAQIDVHDMETFARYREKVPATIERYGGRYLVRGGDVTPLEGESPLPRLVIIEFADLESAKAWYNSPEYQAVLPLRLQAARGTAVIVEGLEEVMPRSD